MKIASLAGTYARRGSRAAVIVAHPDDETLWCGGFVLMHPEWHWTVVSLCRAGDPDRASKFYRALRELGAVGNMADLDDGPEQTPLPGPAVEQVILNTLPRVAYDLIITHSREGEYTRHRRHEEVGRAARTLWRLRRLQAERFWTFAYGDGDGHHLPRASPDADLTIELPESIWSRKFRIITETYGLASESFEARAAPRAEAFRCRDLKSLLEESHRGGEKGR